MSADEDDLATALALADQEGAAILLLTPSLSTHTDSACMDLLTVWEPDAETVVLVSLAQSPIDRLETWASHVEEPSTARLRCIDAEETTQSSAETVESLEMETTPVSVDTVSDPGDLTGIGIAFSEQLAAPSDPDRQTVVCFHSLTALLQYAGLQDVFKFLHTLIGRIRNNDIVAHFHADPSAHDAQTMNTLKQLFDTVVRIDRDGNRTITSR